MPDSTSEPLYTNTGEWYYNKVTDSTQVSIYISQNMNEDDWPVFSISINNGTAKPTDMPGWTSAYSMDFVSLPLFTFKTNDGKYGIEGIATIGNESMDTSYLLLAGGLMYYRFIEGQTPELYYCFDPDSLTPLTITMTNGVVSYSSFNQTPTALNGTYLLSITDEATGDFTLMSGPTVLNDTSFYMADCLGDVSVEVEGEGESFIVLGEAIAAGCYGQISDYNTASKLSIYDFGRNYSTITSNISTSDAESGDGLVLGAVTITADGTEQPSLTHFIVPKDIYEPVSIPVMPKIEPINIVGWFPVKKIELNEFDYKSGGFTTQYNVLAVLSVNAPKYTGYVYKDTSATKPIQKIKLFNGDTEASGKLSGISILVLTQ